MKEYTYEVWQDGRKVASVTGTDHDVVRAEIWRYAMQYAQDGGECSITGPNRYILMPDLRRTDTVNG